MFPPIAATLLLGLGLMLSADPKIAIQALSREEASRVKGGACYMDGSAQCATGVYAMCVAYSCPANSNVCPIDFELRQPVVLSYDQVFDTSYQGKDDKV